VGVRTRIGKGLEATLGNARTDRVREAERRTRQQLADRLAPRPVPVGHPTVPAGPRLSAAPQVPHVNPPIGEPNDRQGGWRPSDPFVAHPQPTVTRHDLLRGLHEVLAPRTYLEIGVNEGSSLTLSRARTIAIDPDFLLRRPVRCDLVLEKAKSDDFFSRPDALAHFAGLPVDLAFIDGMHLSEFAVRDFINVQRHLSPAGVTVFDDVLPRNALEAARVRRTGAWAGDVFKAVQIIARESPDLVVVLINTWPTGTAVVIGGDPESDVLQEAYPSLLGYLEAPDPQTPPPEYLSRSAAVDPADLLASPAWSLLVAARESGDPDLIERAKDGFRSIPTLG
jgi:predicted O-methyltransferase YrrM